MSFSLFFSLLGQVKSHHCKSAIGVLYAARSQKIKYWKELDSRITDAANEAKDNVKYLSTLDKLFIPLMKCTPVSFVFVFLKRKNMRKCEYRPLVQMKHYNNLTSL